MSDMSSFLDQRRRTDLAADPDYTPKHADKVDAAMLHLNSLLAERAVLETATRALDVSRHAAFEAITNNTQATPSFDRAAGVYPGLCGDLRAEVEEEEALTPDQAHDKATDQILSFAESVADWMAKACDCDAGRRPLDVRDLEPLQIIEGSPALLVSVLMNGDNSQVLRAVYRLREMAAKNFAAEIDARAAELLAAAL